MLRMFPQYQKAKEVTEPAKDTPIADSSQLPDPEQDYIIGQISAVELELTGYRAKQRVEDEEERITRVSVEDVQRACDLLQDGLAAKRLLQKKLAQLQAKLSALNVSRQKSEQVQSPLIQQIAELEAALELIEPDSEAAAVLQTDIESLTQELAKVREEALDKTEDEIWQRLLALRKSLNKHRAEKYAALIKQKFVVSLDARVTEFRSEMTNEYELKDFTTKLTVYFSNATEYLKSYMGTMDQALYLMVDEAKIKVNIKTASVIALILAKFADDEVADQGLLEDFIKTDLGRVFRKIDDKIDMDFDIVAEQLGAEMHANIAKVVLSSRVAEVQKLQEEASQQHHARQPSIQKDYAYYQVQFFNCAIRLFKELLTENLSRYNLIKDQIEEYEQQLEAMYFNGTAHSYKILLLLHHEIEHEKDEDTKELLELKHQLCYLTIVDKEQDLAQLYSNMVNVLNSKNKTREQNIELLAYKIAFHVYSGLLSDFITLLDTVHQQIKELQNSALSEDEQQALNIALLRNQSQSILYAMRIHIAYCRLPNTPYAEQRSEVRFALRLSQYIAEADKYEIFHQQTYCDATNPCVDFKIDEEILYTVSELMKSLPTAPIKSFVCIIENFEFSPKQQKEEDWSVFDDSNEEDLLEPSGSEFPPPPPPPLPPQSSPCSPSPGL